MKITLGDGVRFLRLNNLKRKSRNRRGNVAIRRMGEWRMRRFLAAGGTVLACKLFDGFRVKAIAVAGLLLILAAGGLSQSAYAQGSTGTVIPPPPRQSGASQGNEDDPGRAFSPTTGQNLYWDCNKKTWIDAKTGESAPGGFEGRRAGDGEVIPPPPAQSGASQGNEDDPGRAFSPTTGQNMHWDPDQKTWRDSKTGQPVPGGFKGRRVKDDCPPPSTATTPAPAGVGLLIVEPKVFFDLIEGADARTAGVPKPSEETQKVEEKKQPSWWESLIPSIGIGVGGGREDRERRFPDDPRR